ncbi:hypothetical protein JW796_00470 [Candidatus Dojkabacteria bacterium]|nr:hypothetical protein [Candidatus Dojkabacteria bacterium]
MPMPTKSSSTFSDRRGASGSIQMNRSEQTVNTPLKLDSSKEVKGKGDSIVKVLIWVVVMALVTVVIYLLINNLTEKKTTDDNQQDAEEQEIHVETLEPIIADKNSTSEAESAPDDDFLTVAQSVGSNSSDSFTIDSFSTESYEDFFRVVFMVTSSGSAKFPLTEATLENQKISINFNNISEDRSGLKVGVEQRVLNSIVTMIMHNTASGEDTENYTIELSDETGYFMHLLEEPNRIVIDIKEVEEEQPFEETEEAEEIEGGTGVSEDTGTGKPTVKTLTNEFSRNPQWIVTDVTGNVVNTVTFKWQNYGSYTKIAYDLSGGIPNVSAQLQKDGEVKLVVVMQNRVSRNAESTVEINNGNVKTMEAVTAGNTTTLTLNLNKESDYRIYATESPMQFFIEVKN